MNTISIVIPKAKDCANVVKFEIPKAQVDAAKANNQQVIMTNAYIAKGVPGIPAAKAVRITIEAILGSPQKPKSSPTAATVSLCQKRSKRCGGRVN